VKREKNCRGEYYSPFFVESIYIITKISVFFIYMSTMKKGFTLIEMMIVLVIIGILMAATMNFWSNRIVDLKAQSLKEQFVGYYNELYSQNMTSRFRDGKKYEQLSINFSTGISYSLDGIWFSSDPKLAGIEVKNMRFADTLFATAALLLRPYTLWCAITSSAGASWNVLFFNLVVPQNGKQYCFEIKSETCKLVETTCVK